MGRAGLVRSVERALTILDGIGAESDGAPLVQIQARVRLPLVTVYRLLRTLRSMGYAEQDIDTGRWHVGWRVMELRGRVSTLTRLATVARPFLKDLMLESGGLAHLAVFRRGEVVYVDTVWDLRSLDTYRPPTRRNPAHSTALGKVFLAELSGEQLERFAAEKGLAPQTPHTITTLDRLMEEVERVRACGHAIDVEENGVGARCFAAPVRDYTERVVAAISIAGDGQRFPDERRPALIALIVDTAARLSARLGHVVAEGAPDAVILGTRPASDGTPTPARERTHD
ncbi:MAG: IclR family transcriptional regulator [Chloroflexota bacterium]